MQLTTLDVKEFYRRIRGENALRPWGTARSALMVSSCMCMGHVSGRAIRYGTSGDVSGDHNAVVGYAAIAVM